MKNLIFSIISLIILFSSCKDGDTNFLPNVSGKSGEVVLVIDPDQWISNSGKEFRNVLSAAFPALPQPEPSFDLVHIPYDAFTSIFRTHRNIIFAKVDKNVHEPKYVVQKDVWAKPQIVINIIAPDDAALESIVKEKGDLLVHRIWKMEMERYRDVYARYEQKDIGDRIEKKFGIRLSIPKGYTVDLDTTDFMWIESRGYGDVVQGIFVFSYDKPNVSLTSDYIFAKKDQFTKQYVPGPVANSYMAVEREVNPFRREMTVNDIDVIELRSLWKVENDFMGGPFVSFTMEDVERNKIIHIDAFVFAPRFDKRDYMRQVEAILNSVQKTKNESVN